MVAICKAGQLSKKSWNKLCKFDVDLFEFGIDN